MFTCLATTPLVLAGPCSDDTTE